MRVWIRTRLRTPDPGIEVEQVVSWSENFDEKMSMERSQLENYTFGCVRMTLDKIYSLIEYNSAASVS